MNQPLAKFLPHNAQEFENEMRALIVAHMGLGEGNPTGWVVKAVCEAYQRGFGVGFAAGAKAGQQQPVYAPTDAQIRRDLNLPSLPLVERINPKE